MLFTVISSLEVLGVNLFITFFCAKRKFPIYVNVIILAIITVLLYGFSFVVIKEVSGPSIWSIVLGLMFIIPLHLMLDIKIHKLVYIMTFTWLYTLVISGSAQILGILLFLDNVVMYSVIIQTVLFVLTLRYMTSFTNSRVLLILKKLDTNWLTLLYFTISLFVIAVIVRFYSIFMFAYFQVILLILLLLLSHAFHQVMYMLIRNKISLGEINQIAYTDELTTVNNRYSLFKSIDSYISLYQEFGLIFIDLDKFKLVNDTFSHSIGDKYLQLFANSACDYLLGKGTLYRFAGDEFICLITNDSDTFNIDEFIAHITKEMEKEFNFYGVSMGMSFYPKDGNNADNLIQKADQLMYENKDYHDEKKSARKTRR